jgi:hypothetical protein
MNISKELLSEVLQKEVVAIETTMYGHFDIEFKNDYGTEINKYELAHKCKEWAVFNDIYCIKIQIVDMWTSLEILKGHSVVYCEGFDTEQEAIFKACQWILENKNEKN